MQRIKIVLADADVLYVERLEDFITTEFSSRIKVIACTRKSTLEHYLQTSGESVDILLAHPDYLAAVKDNSKIKMVVALKGRDYVSQDEGTETEVNSVYRYQLGDQLVNEVLNLYLEEFSYDQQVPLGLKKTKIIAVYSVAGGTGKTSVAMGLAANLGNSGHDVLLLSMETISSLNFILPPDGKEGFTKILLSLEENADLIPSRMDMYKTKARQHNFNYIEPPHCFLEVSELNHSRLGLMLDKIAKGSKYDFVILDMDSRADEKILTIVNHSSKVILTQTNDPLCNAKTETFLSQIRKIENDNINSFFDKIIILRNKCTGTEEPAEIFGLKDNCRLPKIQNLWQKTGEGLTFDSTGEFVNSMSELAALVGG